MDALLDHANGLLAVGDGSATAEACRADMCIIRSALDETERVCGEAYQVVGVLLNDLGIFDTERATKILDNLAQARLVHEDVLPWPCGPKMEAVAQVVEELEPDGTGWHAKVRWVYNPIPVGEQLYWPQPTPEQKDPHAS